MAFPIPLSCSYSPALHFAPPIVSSLWVNLSQTQPHSFPISIGSGPSPDPIPPASISSLPFPLLPQPLPFWVNANYKSIRSVLSGPPPHCASPAAATESHPLLFSPSLLPVLLTPAGAEMTATQGHLASPQHPNTVLVRQWRRVGWERGQSKQASFVSREDVWWLQSHQLLSILPSPQPCPIQGTVSIL